LPTGYSSVPIIGVTAHVIKGYRERELDAGMNNHMKKPINKDALLDTVTRQLSKRLAPRTLAPRSLVSAKSAEAERRTSV
jgi:CheY-like chemotaxis protein